MEARGKRAAFSKVRWARSVRPRRRQLPQGPSVCDKIGASSDCSRPVNDYVHIEAADLRRPNARFTTERQGYQVLTPFGKLGYSRRKPAGQGCRRLPGSKRRFQCRCRRDPSGCRLGEANQDAVFQRVIMGRGEGGPRIEAHGPAARKEAMACVSALPIDRRRPYRRRRPGARIQPG